MAVSRQAAFEMERAGDLAALGDVGLPSAALAAFRATRLEPDSQVALARFRDLCAKGGFDFAPQDPRIVDVERELVRTKNSAALLRRAADLHRAAKNPHGQVDYLGRYLQVQPGDELSARQWRAITTGPLVERQETRVKLSTREIVDGIRTGGWKRASIATASAEAVSGATGTQGRAGGLTGQQRSSATGLFDDVRASELSSPQGQTRAGAPLGAGADLVGARDTRRPPIARRADGPVVVVANASDEGGGSGKLVAGVVIVLVIAVVAGLLSLAKSGAEGTNKAFEAAAKAGDTTAGIRAQVATQLDKAREAMAKGAYDDALFAADVVMGMEPTAAEAADAHFLRATALAGAGQRLKAQTALARFFEVAPLRHHDHHAAKALEEKLVQEDRR